MAKLRSKPYRTLALAYACFSVALIAVGVRYLQLDRQDNEKLAFAQLSAISEARVRQLMLWRRERLRDLLLVHQNASLMPVVKAVLAGTATRSQEAAAHSWLEGLLASTGCKGLSLVTRDGRIRLAAGSPVHPADLNSEFLEVVSGRQPLFFGRLTRRKDPNSTGVTVAAAVQFHPDKEPGGALLCYVDAGSQLMPIFSTWPGAVETGEMMLLRRDGDHLTVLNELRLYPGSAFRLRIPMSKADLVSMRALGGEHGNIAGPDYRGNEVLAHVRAVPDSPWILVVKIDEDEVQAAYRERRTIYWSSILLLIVLSGVVLFVSWARREGAAKLQALEAERKQLALRNRYDSLARYANDIILLFDEEGRVLDANEKAVAAYGYSREELLELRADDLLDPEHREAAEKLLMSAERDGGARYETLHRRKDGTTFPAEASVRIIQTEDKKYSQSILRDITERKRLEEELRAANQMMQAILDSSPAAIITHSREGLVTSWNKAAERMTGFTAAETVGRSNPSVPPHALDANASTRRRVLGGEIVESIEAERTRKDGSTIVVSVSAAPLRDGSGQVVGTVGIVLDVTEHRKAEVALKESEELFRTMFEQAAFGIVMGGLDEKYAIVNPRFCEITGYSSDELASRTYRDITHPEDLAEDVALGERLMRGEIPRMSLEKRFVRKDGSTRWVQMNISFRRDETGQVTGFIGLLEDIHRRKEAEAHEESLQEQLIQAQKMESVGRLAGGIAHDFNNYLTVINGYCDLLLARFPAEDPSRKPVELVRQAGERATALTRQLLTFSRKQVVQPRALDLNEVVTEFQSMGSRLLGEDVELKTELELSLDPVWADSSQMQQVIINLAVNARDSMVSGGRLRIATSNVRVARVPVANFPEAEPGRYVLLSVSDNGAGMDPATLERIFEPFFTTKPMGVGTGLGLATVYGIVRQAGGFITVDSTPGRGSTFKVYIPSHAGEAPNADAGSPMEEMPVGTETILLVEDEPGLCQFAAEVLRGCGYRVLEAANSTEALSLFEKRSAPIHLLVTDVILPTMAGPDFAEQLSRVQPGLKTLFISGYSGDRFHRGGQIDPSIEYLAKPFTPSQLAGRVRQILDLTA